MDTTLQKWNRIFKIIILIGLITFLILSVIYKYDDCNKCKFKIDNKNININKFLGLYFEKCVDLNVSDDNFSGLTYTNSSTKG